MIIQSTLFKLLLIFGAVLSLIAAAMAFLISYEEYRKHFIDKRRAFMMSMQSAAIIMIFFIVITLVAALVFSNPQCLTEN